MSMFKRANLLKENAAISEISNKSFGHVPPETSVTEHLPTHKSVRLQRQMVAAETEKIYLPKE